MKITVPNLLVKIVNDQIEDGQFAGLFPAERFNTFWRYRRSDENLFFSVSTAFVLKEITPYLPENEQNIVIDITKKLENVIGVFQNKTGTATYNFYPTNPPRHFPNGYFMHRFRHYQHPDDIDDTALVYLTFPEKKDHDWLKEKLIAHANTVKGFNKTTLLSFRDKKIYSTWFGEKMPIDFDVCALANIQFWVHRNHLKINDFDTDTLIFIEEVITQNLWQKQPFRVALYYPKPAIIAYHLGRLLAAFDDSPRWTNARNLLIQGCEARFVSAQEFFDKLLLGITLARFGKPVSMDFLPTIIQEIPTDDCAFFIAPLLSYYPRLQTIAENQATHISWRCPAHTYALVAEFLALKSKR